MTIEQQCVSLELAKRLKELGVKQESIFYWSVALPETSESESELNLLSKIQPMLTQEEWGDKFTSYSAFTSAELGEIFSTIGSDLFIKAYGEVFNFRGTQLVGTLGVINLIRRPDMTAKMLIYLLENNLITLEK